MCRIPTLAMLPLAVGVFLTDSGGRIAAAGSPGRAAGGQSPAISADGRFVAFASSASNLIGADSAARDTNGRFDVFVRDRLRKTTERVSVGGGGQESNGSSGLAGVAISADGRFVAFDSNASDLTAEHLGGLFVRDRLRKTTERISGSPVPPALSGDGRFVVFTSAASKVVAGDANGQRDVFVRDRLRGTTTRASVDSSGRQWHRESVGYQQAVSAHGRVVSFTSGWDVYVRDRVRRKTELISVGARGKVSNGESFENAISADGRFVTFRSEATNLVAADRDTCVGADGGHETCADVFVRDRQRHSTELVSVSSRGRQGNGNSFPGTISANGRFVAYASFASNLVERDTNDQCNGDCGEDVFVRDRLRRTTTRVSVGSAGKQANGESANPAISANGRFVAFQSDASSLAGGDKNRADDVFVRDRVKKTTDLVSVAAPSTGGAKAGSFWKESYAERRALAKVRIPCKRIHPVTRTDKTCDRKTQMKALKRRNALIAELNETIRKAKDGSWEQTVALQELSDLNHSNFSPDIYLARIRHGYSLATARCAGTGRPDRSGQRFSRFRCDARVDDRSIRLAVRPSGRATFRWAIT